MGFFKHWLNIFGLVIKQEKQLTQTNTVKEQPVLVKVGIKQ